MTPPVRRTKTLVNKPDEPLSDSEIAEATIAFANGHEINIRGQRSTKSIWKDQEGAFIVVEDDKEAECGYLKEYFSDAAGVQRNEMEFLNADGVKTVFEFPPSGPEHLRAIVRERLNLVMTNPGALAKKLLTQESRSDIRKVLKATDRGLSILEYEVFWTKEQLFNRGIEFLLDERRSFGAKLCQCQLHTCGKFFFEIRPKRGRRQRRYCTNDHMHDGHKEKKRARTQQVRDNKKKRLRGSR
jgi:hypothetical protein